METKYLNREEERERRERVREGGREGLRDQEKVRKRSHPV